MKSNVPDECEAATPARMSAATRVSAPTWALTIDPLQSSTLAPGSPMWWYSPAPQVASWPVLPACCGASEAPSGVWNDVPPKRVARPERSRRPRPAPSAPGEDRLDAIEESPPMSTRRSIPIPEATASTRSAIAPTVLDAIAPATCGRTVVLRRPARSTGSSVAAEATLDGSPAPARLIAETR